MKKIVFFALFSLFFNLAFANNTSITQPTDTDSAIILVYHRFGEDRYPTTSVSLSEFQAQLAYLKAHNHVLPLQEIVEKIKAGQPLPSHTVAITIDDAYRSVYTEAWPLLRQYHFPFTVFVATQGVDHHYPALMTWDMLRDLSQHGVSIQNHTTVHAQLPEFSLAFAEADLTYAENDIVRELGVKPIFYAYPFGEYTPALEAMVKEKGYQAAFAQYSSVFDAASDFYAIPRFGINQHYGELPRFIEILKSLPMHVTWVKKPPAILASAQTPFRLAFTLQDSDIQPNKVHCFLNSGEKLPIEVMHTMEIQVSVQSVPAAGHIKVNCTAPVGNGSWRWLGVPIWVDNGVSHQNQTFAQSLREN